MKYSEKKKKQRVIQNYIFTGMLKKRQII